ncbi:non-homologous end-joining factor 1 [Plakobranchus ocellatus]|uniref:Non-homologous end-joining factor 1 n=1 Tax=Plakobranchus ocellatus TaxID=259542 RepID=A0AAV4BJS9_9GAST|nr:non-homologous end-joining factor 1 [Plakobranchus ocellatus]
MTELEWRRQWKPDLSSCPWKPLQTFNADLVRECLYLVKTKFLDDAYEFLITDMIHFWYESLSGTALKRRIKELNPNIEAPISKILDQIRQSLELPGKETRVSVTTAADEEANLDIESHLAGVPFSYSFKASSATGSMAKDHLTVPLMAMVGELCRQRQELFKLLAAKDKQIDNFKAQGASVTQRSLETAPFDEVAFQNSMITSKGFEEEVKTYGEKAFASYGQELYRAITTKRAWLLSSPMKDELKEALGSEGQSKGAPSIESWGNRLPPSIANKNQSPSKSVSPVVSPEKSRQQSPGSGASSTDSTPVKDTELLRRQALERKLEQEENKLQEKSKKKKKLKF